MKKNPSTLKKQRKVRGMFHQKTKKISLSMLELVQIPDLDHMFNELVLLNDMGVQTSEKRAVILKTLEQGWISRFSLENGLYTAFKTSFLTTQHEPIFMVFVKTKAGQKKRWKFLRFARLNLNQSEVTNDIPYFLPHISPQQSIDMVGGNTDNSYETCPICNGDGGVRGGCYKCSGSGWVSAAARTTYSLDNASAEKKSQDTRISNSSNYGLNAGAHYRERDGRIGSYPSYDDYSEEGEA